MHIQKIHHIAIICSDYEKSKQFYLDVLGCEVVQEVYRKERDSYMLDLSLNGEYVIELFSFPETPPRPTRPEATGLRHLAFQVANIDEAATHLKTKGVKVEDVRVDEYTGKRFLFFWDPDKTPLELYEA